MPLTLRLHDQPLSICRLPSDAEIPPGQLRHPISALIRSYGETTLICPTAIAVENGKREDGWIALQFTGPFDFALTGIMNQVSVPLATAGISIYAISTFDTDYLLIKAEKRNQAIETLSTAGHIIETPAGDTLCNPPRT